MDEIGTFDRAPSDRCSAVSVRVRGRARDVHASCDLGAGERIRLFTRRCVRLGPNGTQGETVNMPVLEIGRADGGFVRMYVHPTHGCMLSSLDLNL